jgi:hypothetical protein
MFVIILKTRKVLTAMVGIMDLMIERTRSGNKRSSQKMQEADLESDRLKGWDGPNQDKNSKIC